MSQRFKIAAYVYPQALRMPTGVSMLTLNMVKVLAKNRAAELSLLASADELDSGGKMPAELGLDGIPVISLPWKRAFREALWLGTSLPTIEQYIPKDSWVYCSMETYVPARRCKRIVTVHHLEPQLRASLLSRKGMRARTSAWRLRKAVSTADLLVAQSTFTKTQVMDEFDIPDAKIQVVGSGVDDELFAMPVGGATSCGASAYGPYIISAGAFQPRKGTDYLFAMARELQRRGSPLKIVCPFGLRGLPPFTDEVKALPNVVALDYISREELLNLIRGAVCMVIPSRLEGFGLTAIESMALGTPVVAANNTALPETLGGAGVLLDPTDALALANAAEKLFKDQVHRAHLAALGRRRAEDFTWTRCMERLLAGIAQAQRGIIAG